MLKNLNKSTIYNYETNQNIMTFISTLKKSFSNSINSTTLITEISNNSNSYYNLSSLSQAYVFYMLSQTQLFSKYDLRSILQCDRTYPFLRDTIKNYCMTQGIFDTKSRYEKIH
ncbi:hypothetical protein IHE45_10G048200 [Dioscorea alata]|uniref:Uncharacterized protein n=1 Tax=Dioscorea alata TaxID=55571 RepID=A0ACB7VAP5_DIOAL|nr:hypothetical protein IHE45_10G048200 [Dioscorea alata]